MFDTLTTDTLKPDKNETGTGSVGDGLKEGEDNKTQYPGVRTWTAALDMERVSDSPCSTRDPVSQKL
jgi:hypothetical protein